MAQSVRELARAAMAAYERLESFEATQKISAGPIDAEARVRFRKPNKITVEYRSYQDPLVEFEERFTGGVEFVADELVGMQLIYDGRGTWLYEAKNDIAFYRPGRTLYSPLPGTNSLGEIGFLRDLTRDFLLRDAGQESIDGQTAHRLGIKPKAQHRSLLLKEEVFPLKKATLALDAETSFPLRITYTPAGPSTLSLLVGSSTSITIEYSDLILDKVNEERFTFTPPEGTRVFREEQVPKDALEETLPFIVPMQVLEKDVGYALYGNRAAVTLNDEKDRAYALLTLVPSKEGDSGERTRHVLTLRVGNYLSRNMSRRRAMLSDQGEEITIDELSARFLDRGALVKDQIPTEAARQIIEVGWEKDGVYWFLLGEELGKGALIELATTLVQAQSK